MNNDKKRLVLFLVIALPMTIGMQYLLDALGFLPKPQRKLPAQPNPQAAAKAEPGKAAPGKAEPEAVAKAAQPALSAPPAKNEEPVKLVPPGELLIGSARDKTPGGFKMALQLDQKGAGVDWLASSRFDAEFIEGKPRNRPLELIQDDPLAPPSFSLNLVKQVSNANGSTNDVPLGALDGQVWEVVLDADGHAVHKFQDTNAATGKKGEGEEVTFRTSVGEPVVTVTKTYRLWKGADGFDLDIQVESPSADQNVVYRLMGPHNIPIEGEWYTGTFRDVFFGQKDIGIVTKAASEVIKEQSNPKVLSVAPLQYAGVENQYFTVFLEPYPPPANKDESHIAETMATVIHANAEASQKSDVSVQLTSKPLDIGPNRPALHHYRVFAGPKRGDELASYGAAALAAYRKSGWFTIPFSSTMAQFVISPLLHRIYGLTETVAGWFGGKRGNYGLAIILLTITVRLCMFPLSRKQAISAKRMQDLQPHMAELKEKYKDDKERMTKETFALYGKHGVSPLGGCLPALIQLPIFVGLWQALNNSVALRHASFLWIQNLAAPDMLFKFPFSVPFLGDYFNILPFLVVSLMLVQTKLFSPPATTPEAEMQMKMMKFMMIFMAFMFYRVPSGLGIYFITSSMWAIGERLLLPKMAAAHTSSPPDAKGDDGSPPGGGNGKWPFGGGKGPNGGNGKVGGWWAKQMEKVEKLMDEAAKDGTHRNDDRDREKDKEPVRPRARPGKRR
ncbi:MAG TPA: YidC/Oxa1 family insertase periplasmic-domain containing protein [Isosphaeraceae bacterium]|jgi:YidC/Oxa1 family membrane protein insertase|nr:YidC/Oxa1 family insertase periplasmic-domain containing protein [Isosphaeraceae bacterium]